MKTTLEDFNTSVSQLRENLRNDQEIEQNHFGDFLMIQDPPEWEKFANNYKIWLNHPENVSQGEPVWQIEMAGPSNGYTWKIISQGNE